MLSFEVTASFHLLPLPLTAEFRKPSVFCKPDCFHSFFHPLYRFSCPVPLSHLFLLICSLALPSPPSCLTFVHQKETPQLSQKQPRVSPFLFPSPHPHFHAATGKSCKVVVWLFLGFFFFLSNFVFPRAKGTWFFPVGCTCSVWQGRCNPDGTSLVDRTGHLPRDTFQGHMT